MDNIASAVEFVANHFDTVEKAGTNVAGVVIAAAAFWVGKKAFQAAAYFTRTAYSAAKHRLYPPVDPLFARILNHFDDPNAVASRSSDGSSIELATGGLDIVLSKDRQLTRVNETPDRFRTSGRDILAVLTAAERKTLTDLVESKVVAVTERDRLALRATLSAPTV